jgi:sulfate adenylyltransferase
LARAGAAAVPAPIAPYPRSRSAARQAITSTGGRGGNSFLIHVVTPLAYCEAMDRNGTYTKARKGEIKGFTAIGERKDPSYILSGRWD